MNFYSYNIWNLRRKNSTDLLHFMNSVSFHYVLFKTKPCILSESLQSMRKCCRLFYQIYRFSHLLVSTTTATDLCKFLSIPWLRGY
jgi:hypothetical protein